MSMFFDGAFEMSNLGVLFSLLYCISIFVYGFVSTRQFILTKERDILDDLMKSISSSQGSTSVDYLMKERSYQNIIGSISGVDTKRWLYSTYAISIPALISLFTLRPVDVFGVFLSYIYSANQRNSLGFYILIASFVAISMSFYSIGVTLAHKMRSFL
jgi:hypothetical protein